MANLERIYTIPLGEIYERVRNKRGKRAVRFVRAFALHHMKATAARISEGVNSLILRDGIEKPPRRIKVRIVKGEDLMARVWLIGEEEKIKEIADKKKAEAESKKKQEEAKKEAAKKKADDAKKAEAKPAASSAQAKPAPAPAQAAKPVPVAPAASSKPAAPTAAKPAAPAPAPKK